IESLIGNLSLDEFLARYNSEDNASFSEILQRHIEETRKKYWWAYEKEKKMLEPRVPDKKEQELLFSESNEAKEVETWKYKAKNALMYYPDAKRPESDTAAQKRIEHANTRASAALSLVEAADTDSMRDDCSEPSLLSPVHHSGDAAHKPHFAI